MLKILNYLKRDLITIKNSTVKYWLPFELGLTVEEYITSLDFDQLVAALQNGKSQC